MIKHGRVGGEIVLSVISGIKAEVGCDATSESWRDGKAKVRCLQIKLWEAFNTRSVKPLQMFCYFPQPDCFPRLNAVG